MQPVVSWAEVHKVHRTVAGIYVKNGVAKSVIYNPHSSGRYSNTVKPGEIRYRVNSMTQGHGITALIAAVEKKTAVEVFEKVAKNQWKNIGSWRVAEIIEDKADDSLVFVLHRA